ncbi:MAG: ATP12 family protein [Pseudomonadota bacterium]
MKRFYKTVSVTAERGILLDARPVRTPRKALLSLPTNALAEAIADEWRAQACEIKPETMKLTGLANAAIDLIAPDPLAFATGLAAYGESDLLCYRADEPPELVARQLTAWEPLLEWAQTRYDIMFRRVRGIIHQAQPAETVSRLSKAIASRNAFELSALSHIVTIGGSLVIALAAFESQIAPDAAFDIAHLDELWQAEQWGEDWMAADARIVRRADFVSACRFLRLLNDD